MRPLFRARLLLGLCLGLAVGLSAARAADDKAKGDTKKTSDNQERVKFNTVDGVELHGIFYASDRGKRAPCVMLLPKIGSNSSQDGWDQLATELQKAGYAVLLFDYRGHGDSTNVDPNFWNDTTTVPLARLTTFNRDSVRGGNQNPPKASISYKDYNKSYYPALVNDVAAAKSYLDQRNNNGDCNSANLILIGAEDGATLGALWLYTDLSLFRATVLNPLNNIPMKFENTPEGKDVTACVWLTISPTLGTYRPWVTTWMQMAGQAQKVPMAFVYGEKDSTGTQFSQQCYRYAKPASGKNKLTGEHTVKGSKLAGAALLDDKLDARDWIANSYLKFVKENAVSPTYDTKDVQKEVYAWIVPGTTRPILWKPMGEKQLPPVPYTAFLR
jgi:pimeloyl-ACP methyl ester carboxylesterase